MSSSKVQSPNHTAAVFPQKNQAVKPTKHARANGFHGRSNGGLNITGATNDTTSTALEIRLWPFRWVLHHLTWFRFISDRAALHAAQVVAYWYQKMVVCEPRRFALPLNRRLHNHQPLVFRASTTTAICARTIPIKRSTAFSSSAEARSELAVSTPGN